MGEKKSLMVLLDERKELADKLEWEESPVEYLETVDKAIQVKGAGVALHIGTLDTMIESLDSTIRKLQERKKMFLNRRESLKEYVLNAMQVHGIKKIECPECTISVQKNGKPRVEILNEKQIPMKFWKRKVEDVVDKESILDAYKNDGEIPQGVDIVWGESLRIR